MPEGAQRGIQPAARDLRRRPEWEWRRAIDGRELTGWGEQLIAGRHLNEGIEALRLTISLYPTASWYSYRVLSQAYVADHQEDRAIATLKELLQKDPNDEFGQAYLKSLEAKPKR
jgi:tetratricopeptide (TPR) repeat protein